MHYIYALDLSMLSTGVAIFDENTNLKEILSIKTNPKHDHGTRLKFISDKILELRNKYKTNLVILERGFQKFNTATQVLYRVHGLINYLFYDCKQIYIPPNSIKLKITGSGKASKQDVKNEILKIYPDIKLKNDDESDAVGIGLTYFIKIGAFKHDK